MLLLNRVEVAAVFEIRATERIAYDLDVIEFFPRLHGWERIKTVSCLPFHKTSDPSELVRGRIDIISEEDDFHGFEPLADIL